MTALPNIVLVHGAWADGSSWSAVIERLQADGYHVTAPQFPMTRLADDVARLRQVLARQNGPTLVAGHSYGGQIITALGADTLNVVGLVYIAAFGLDEGESIGALLEQVPGGPALAHLDVDQNSFAWLPEDDFVNHFAADVDPVKARVMFAVQQPLHWSALGEVMGVPAWKSLPTWFLIADGDQAIPPDAQRQFALAWAPPPWRSRPTTWPWSPTQMRCCSSSRRPPRRCRPSSNPLPMRSTHGRSSMTKVVVIGGTGLIGSKVVARLAEHGHEAIAASPKSGVNTLTGEGLAEVLSGAQVVVDVSNSPSFEAEPALDFFTTSTGNLLAAEKTAGVGHHVALSVVGTERLPDSGYIRAKLARTAVGEPVNGTIEIAGPEQFGLDELIRKGLSFRGDPQEVVADPEARYYGARLEERTLLPGADALTLDPRFEDWLVQTAPQR